MRSFRTVAILSMCCLSLLAGLAQASAQEVSFKGKQVTIYVGFSPTSGIGYDTYARVLAQVFGRHLPGNPTVVVSNKPGGGSMTASNYVAQVSPKDGTEIAIVGRGVGMDRLIFGDKSAARFDATQLQWIGSMNNEVSGFFLADTSPVKTLEEVLSGKPFTVGSAGTSSDLHIFSIVMNGIFGAKMKIISGYPGTNEILLGLERAEVDGLIGYSWSAARTGSAEMLRTGKIKNILQLGLRKHPDLPDVPFVMDMVKTADDRQVLEVIFARQAMGRPLFAPPGTPAPVVEALRKGFMNAMTDPELVAMARKIDLEIYPMSGQDLQDMVSRVHKFPEATIKKTQAIANSQ